MTIKQSEGKVQTQGSLTLGVTSTHPSVLARKRKMTDTKNSEAAAVDLDKFALRMESLSNLSSAFDSDELFDDLSGASAPMQDIMTGDGDTDLDQPLQLEDADIDDGDEGVVIGGLDLMNSDQDAFSEDMVADETTSYVEEAATFAGDVTGSDAVEDIDGFGEESLMNDLLAENGLQEQTSGEAEHIEDITSAQDDPVSAETEQDQDEPLKAVMDLPDEMFAGMDDLGIDVPEDQSSSEIDLIDATTHQVEPELKDEEQESETHEESAFDDAPLDQPAEDFEPTAEQIEAVQFETVSEEDAAENDRLSEEMIEAQSTIEEDDLGDDENFDIALDEPVEDFEDDNSLPEAIDVEENIPVSTKIDVPQHASKSEDEDEFDVFNSIFSADRNEDAAFSDDEPELLEEAVDRRAKKLPAARDDAMIAQGIDDEDDRKDEEMKPSKLDRMKGLAARKRAPKHEEEDDLYDGQDVDLDPSEFSDIDDDFDGDAQVSPARGNLKRTVAIGVATLAVVGGVSFGVMGFMGTAHQTAPATQNDGWSPIKNTAQPQQVVAQVAVPAAPADPVKTASAAPATPAAPASASVDVAQSAAAQGSVQVSGSAAVNGAPIKPLDKPADLTADIQLPNKSSFDSKTDPGMSGVISGLKNAQSGDLSDITGPAAPAKDVNGTIKEALAGYASKDDLSSIYTRMDAMQKTIDTMTKSLSTKDAQITKITADLGAAKAEAENAKSLALAQNDVMVKVVRMGEKVDTGEKLIVDLSKRVASLESVDPADKAQVQKQISDITDRLDGLSRDVGLVARVAINGSPDSQGGAASGSAATAKTDPISVFSSTKTSVKPNTIHGKVPSNVKKGDFVKGYGVVLDVMPTSGGSRLVVMENGSVLIK